MKNFLNNPHPKPFHSSGYAAAAQGDALGSSSPETFTQRLSVDSNRRVVRRYREASVVHGHHQHRAMLARTVPVFEQHEASPAAPESTRQANNGRTLATPPSARRQQQRATFVEPTITRYNPFG